MTDDGKLLKDLYRRAMQVCHPDRASAESYSSMLAKAKELTAASRAGNLSLVRKIAEELGVEDASKPEFVQRWTEEDCDRYKKQNRLDQELERAVQGQERNYRGDVSHSIKGQADAVKAILAAGANPNAVDQYSRTALQLATKSGNAEVVSVLLSAGANPNTENGNYEVPLIQAASLGGSIAVVNALLAGEANPNMENGKGLTPLIVAVKWWRTETVSVLLAAGANPDAINKEGASPLDYAEHRMYSAGSPEMVRTYREIVRLLKVANQEITRLLEEEKPK